MVVIFALLCFAGAGQIFGCVGRNAFPEAGTGQGRQGHHQPARVLVPQREKKKTGYSPGDELITALISLLTLPLMSDGTPCRNHNTMIL